MSEGTLLPEPAVEEWRDVQDWPGYQVSSLGRVRSRRRYKGGRVLRQSGEKYRVVTLCRPGTKQGHLVNRLVATAFCGPPPFPGAHARHLNDVQADNRAENVAWGSVTDNAADAERNGKVNRGERHGMVKVSLPDAFAIYCRAAAGQDQATVGADYGLCAAAVSHIVNGRNWRRALQDGGYALPGYNKRTTRRLTEDVVVRIVGLRKAGLTTAEISRQTGVPKGTISPIVSDNEPCWHHITAGLPSKVVRKRFADSEVAEMIALRAAGKSYQEIADAIPGSIGSVYRILNGQRKSYIGVAPAGGYRTPSSPSVGTRSHTLPAADIC